MSSRGTAAHHPCASPPSGVGSGPFFLRQMNGALDIDIAWSLPAIARLVQPTPQGPRADGDALRGQVVRQQRHRPARGLVAAAARVAGQGRRQPPPREGVMKDRKSTRLNSSHANISYAVFCLKKKNK